jgi:hypothetical protein
MGFSSQEDYNFAKSESENGEDGHDHRRWLLSGRLRQAHQKVQTESLKCHEYNMRNRDVLVMMKRSFVMVE